MIRRRDFLAGGLAAAATLGRPRRASAAAFSFGPASFDVTAASALIWLRTDGLARVHVEYGTRADLGDGVTSVALPARDATDFTVVTTVSGLSPDTEYFYRGVIGDGGTAGKGAIGRFRTAPVTAREFRFAWSGDMEAGRQPFTLLDQATALRPEFFLMLGDTMYADVPRSAFRPTLAHYRAKHRENRADAALQRLLRTTSVAAIWDDHEVNNDFDRTYHAIPQGRQAFREYWPVRTTATLYRRFTWTPAVEVFMLDCRSYRSPKLAIDDAAKTMLGAGQKAWLEAGLKASTATFKIVCSSIPCLPETRVDAWSGYATERRALLDFIARERIRNVVILSADIHMALDFEEDGVQEFVAGPIGAVLHCRGDAAAARKEVWTRTGRPFLCDATNFGLITVRPDGGRSELDVRIIDATGATRLRKTVVAA